MSYKTLLRRHPDGLSATIPDELASKLALSDGDSVHWGLAPDGSLRLLYGDDAKVLDEAAGLVDKYDAVFRRLAQEPG